MDDWFELDVANNVIQRTHEISGNKAAGDSFKVTSIKTKEPHGDKILDPGTMLFSKKWERFCSRRHMR